MNYIHLRTKLGEEASFLHSRISAADHRQRPGTEYRRGAVTHGARRYPAVPETVGTVTRAVKIQPLGNSAGGDDDGFSFHGGGVGENPKRPFGEVHCRHCLRDDLSAEALRLLATAVHELGAEDAGRKSRKVLNVGGGGELAAGSDAVRHPSFEEDRLQLRSRRVNGGRVRRRPASDDAELRFQYFLGDDFDIGG